MLECVGRARALAELVAQLAEQLPLTRVAAGFGPVVREAREQRRHRVRAAMELDDSIPQLAREVIALRREPDRAPVVGLGAGVVVKLFARATLAGNHTEALLGIDADSLCGREAIE